MSHQLGKCAGWYSPVYTDAQCRICWKEQNPATKRDGPEPTPQRVKGVPAKPAGFEVSNRIVLPTIVGLQSCNALGEVMQRTDASGHACGCEGKWVRECKTFGLCTLSSPRRGVPCCETCTEFNAAPVRRHLIYYMYPVSGFDWRASCDQLLSRWSLFNGRRVIAVSTNSTRHKLDPIEAVREYIGDDCDFIKTPHRRRLGEVTAFVDLWKRVEAFQTPGDYSFYGHSKGATKPRATSVHLWGDLMYKACLDHWEDVEKDLQTHPITGPFHKTCPAFGRRVQHHYHGTFYWCRNRDVFARNWKEVPQSYGGTEMWPGMMFTEEEAGKLFYSGGAEFSMYSMHEARRASHLINHWPCKERVVGNSEELKLLQAEVERIKAIEVPKMPETRVVSTQSSSRYGAGTYVLYKMLRATGCTLPLDVWQRPSDPVPEWLGDLDGVTIRLLPDSPGYKMAARLSAWQAGPRYNFHIDSDAYPVADINPAFEALSSCALLHQDHVTGDAWEPAVYGITQDVIGRTPQGGVMLWDVEKGWKVLELVKFFCSRGSYWFPFGIGDQTLYRAAFNLLSETPQWFSKHRVDGTRGYVFVHQNLDDTALIVHRTGCKFAPDGVFRHELRLYESLPREMEAYGYYQEYVERMKGCPIIADRYAADEAYAG